MLSSFKVSNFHHIKIIGALFF